MANIYNNEILHININPSNTAIVFVHLCSGLIPVTAYYASNNILVLTLVHCSLFAPELNASNKKAAYQNYLT
jgi:hypothetical protein